MALFTVRPAEQIEDAWQVLLVKPTIRRSPGSGRCRGAARAEETFDAAARRALRTKAGLDAARWYLEQLGTFGDPQRDSRGRCGFRRTWRWNGATS